MTSRPNSVSGNWVHFVFTCCKDQQRLGVPGMQTVRGTHPSSCPRWYDPGSGCRASTHLPHTGSTVAPEGAQSRWLDATHLLIMFDLIHPSTYLLCHLAQSLSHISHPALSDHHALWPSKAPEGGVGWQVGAAQETMASHVSYTVGVLHVEQSTLHDLDRHRKVISATHHHQILQYKIQCLQYWYSLTERDP